MAKYFDGHGAPTAEAAPFFYYPEGADIGCPEPTKQHQDRWDAVAAQVANFDGNLILDSLVRGWSLEETIAEALEIEAEDRRYGECLRDDFEFQLDRDMSMNG